MMRKMSRPFHMFLSGCEDAKGQLGYSYFWDVTSPVVLRKEHPLRWEDVSHLSTIQWRDFFRDSHNIAGSLIVDGNIENHLPPLYLHARTRTALCMLFHTYPLCKSLLWKLNEAPRAKNRHLEIIMQTSVSFFAPFFILFKALRPPRWCKDQASLCKFLLHVLLCLAFSKGLNTGPCWYLHWCHCWYRGSLGTV